MIQLSPVLALVRTGTSLLPKQSSLLWVGHCWPCQPVATLLNMEVLCVRVSVWWGRGWGGLVMVLIYCFFVFSQTQFQIMQNEVRESFRHISFPISWISEMLNWVFLFVFPFNSQLSGHLSHFPHDVYMVLLENHSVHTSQPLTSSKTASDWVTFR